MPPSPIYLHNCSKPFFGHAHTYNLILAGSVILHLIEYDGRIYATPLLSIVHSDDDSLCSLSSIQVHDH
jgi:hypothetical protein